MNKQRGITLIALIVTIVVLLILASISIKVLTGDNGLINQAKNGKEASEISEEKEIINIAVTQATEKDKRGELTKEALKKELDRQTGEGKTEVSEAGEKIEVCFVEKKRYYEVDKEGDIGKQIDVIEDENPGDITKDGKCDGSRDKPYEINCIEDLVVLSNLVNGKGVVLKNGKAEQIEEGNTFEEKYIVLKRDLDFKSKYSYIDSTRTDFGNINGDDTDGNSLMTEMTTGTGFIPIGYEYNNPFKGNFEGENNRIDNLYINSTDKQNVGLFGTVNAIKDANVMISNFEISGNISYTFPNIDANKSPHVGIIGLIGGSTTGKEKCVRLINIKNYCNINGNGYYDVSGGIVGDAYLRDNNNIIIEDCIVDNVNITSNTYAGGIVGIAYSEMPTEGSITIKNSFAKAKIMVEGRTENTFHCSVGGIIGDASAGGGEVTIENCYFIGTVSGPTSTGGIIGRVNGNVDKNTKCIINNVYTTAMITTGKYKGGVIGQDERGETEIALKNIYHMLDNVYGHIKTTEYTETNVNKVTGNDIKNSSFITTLNNNITDQSWRKWKVGENGYPVFE